MEKAFDSIEHSILLERLFEIGVNGRCWRIILNWYTSAQSKVHLNTGFSDPFPISRGVKQGSVLSPLLFLIAVDPLLKTLKCKHAGLSIHGNFMGGAAHADDLRTIATSKCSVVEQANIINKFTSGNHLKLNSSKTEIIRIAYCHPQDNFISLFCFLPILILLPRGSVLEHGGSTTSQSYDLFKKILLKLEELFLLLERLMHSKGI